MGDTPTGLCMGVEPLVARVLAPNPTPYTFTGTQSFLVGSSDLAVIDPGPESPEHLKALLRCIAGRKVSAIVCTHTHRDHSPGSRALKAATGAPIIGCAPLAIDDKGPRADASFDLDYAPDGVLADGESLSGDGWTLQAIATPGHTSNHLCFAMPENGVLFSGDHVMGWSTTVVSPPDGSMADYIASLEKLRGRSDRIFYPAHGEAIAKPQQLLRGLVGHRKQREGQIVRLLAEAPYSVPQMVERMYVGLDARLVGAAERSVLAHLIDLRDRGIVVEEDAGQWRSAA